MNPSAGRPSIKGGTPRRPRRAKADGVSAKRPGIGLVGEPLSPTKLALERRLGELLLASLDPEAESSLREKCSELELSRGQTADVIIIAEELHRYVRGREKSQTPKNQLRELQRLHGSIEALRVELIDLNALNFTRLTVELRGTLFPGRGAVGTHLFPKEERGWWPTTDDLLAKLAAGIELAQKRIAESVQPGVGGRAPVTPMYATYVGHLMRAVVDAPGFVARTGVPSWHGKKFKTLSEAVFIAAGVHALPEAAIRMAAKAQAKGEPIECY